MASKSNGKRKCTEASLCSWNITSTDMRNLACPNDSRICGLSDPNIRLGMNQSTSFTITKNYMDYDNACNYVFSVDDQIAESELSPYNRKHMMVYFNVTSGLNIYIVGAESEQSIVNTNVKTANSYSVNFTQPNTKKFYVVAKGITGAKSRDIYATITFAYYTYDPACAKFRYWNNTACVNNFDEYCATLTDQYRLESKNENATVYYNGDSCVVKIVNRETVEEIVIIQKTKIIDAIGVETVITNTNNIVNVKEFEAGTLSEQESTKLTMLFITIGLLFYVVFSYFYDKRKLKKKIS